MAHLRMEDTELKNPEKLWGKNFLDMNYYKEL